MIRKSLLRVIDLYLAGVVAWVVAWKSWRDRKGGLGFVNAWAFWGLATAAPLGSVRLWGRGPRKIAALAWLAGGAALLAGRYRWVARDLRRVAVHPLAAATGQDGRAQRDVGTLRVMSFNVLKENENADVILSLIRRAAPDVVLIQELEPEMNRRLQAALDEYTYCEWQCHRRPGAGFGFFSRYPFEANGLWDSPATRPYAARISLQAPGGAIDVYNVHLLSLGPGAMRKTGVPGNFRIREMQMETLADVITERAPIPALALGDFNMTEGNEAYRIAAQKLTDAWVVAGRGPGWTWPRAAFPPERPLLRLDYCFCTPDIRPVSMHVMTDRAGSDHCPIVVDVALPGQTEAACERRRHSAPYERQIEAVKGDEETPAWQPMTAGRPEV